MQHVYTTLGTPRSTGYDLAAFERLPGAGVDGSGAGGYLLKGGEAVEARSRVAKVGPRSLSSLSPLSLLPLSSLSLLSLLSLSALFSLFLHV
jgi:hypothetical protein